jgi:hypothetical protein
MIGIKSKTNTLKTIIMKATKNELNDDSVMEKSLLLTDLLQNIRVTHPNGIRRYEFIDKLDRRQIPYRNYIIDFLINLQKSEIQGATSRRSGMWSFTSGMKPIRCL